MRKPSPTNKRRPVCYVYLGIYLFLSAFIVFQSCLPGELSSKQSGFIGSLVAGFANLFPDSSTAKMVEAENVSLEDDSTFLNLVDSSLEKPQIVTGTTTRLIFDVSYPKLKKNEFGNPSFEVVPQEDGYYSPIVDVNSKVVRIVAGERVKEDCSILVKAGEASYRYDFSIVGMKAPQKVTFEAPEEAIARNDVFDLDCRLVDPRSGVSEPRDDSYLRRFYDPALLPMEVSPSANISFVGGEYLRIGDDVASGTYQVTLADSTFPVIVSEERKTATSPSLNIVKASGSGISLRDYDYENSGILLEANWEGTPASEEVIFEVDDPMIGKLVHVDGRHAYLKGYRKEGTVKVKAVSAVDPSIQSDELSFETTSILPTSMEVSTTKGKAFSGVYAAYKGESITICADFSNPESENITDRNLIVHSDEKKIRVTGSGTEYVTLTFLEVGDSEVEIVSSGNPELEKKISFSIAAERNINPEDDDFAKWIRKRIGHLGLFLVTAVFGFLFFYEFLRMKKKILWGSLMSFGTGCFLAGLTELIQKFVPGRSGLIEDIGIDILGYAIGTILTVGVVLLILWIIKKKKEKKEPTQE